MKRWWKWIVAAVVVLLVAGLAARVLSARKAQQQAQAQAAAAKSVTVVELAATDTTRAQIRELEQGLPVTGALKAVTTAFVKARVPGELQGLTVREGDAVKAGQVVARIEPTEYQARLRQAQDQANAAKVQIDIAQRQFDNNRALMEKGFISKTALDTSAFNLSGAQAHLAVHRGGGQAFPAFFEHKPADLAAVVLGPDDKHVGNRRVGDPHLGAGKAVAAVDLAGAGDHAAGVGAVVGLGQAEAADPLAGGQLGQVLLLGGFVAEFMDRHHHQRALHAHHAAVAGVHALHLARHQAVAHVVQAGAAVLLGDGRAQQSQLAHLAKDGGIGGFVAKGHLHARQQLFLAVGAGSLLHLSLIHI